MLAANIPPLQLQPVGYYSPSLHPQSQLAPDTFAAYRQDIYNIIIITIFGRENRCLTKILYPGLKIGLRMSA